jgi:hypothetical protein
MKFGSRLWEVGMKKSKLFILNLFIISFFLSTAFTHFSGCSPPIKPEGLYPEFAGPQLSVIPKKFRLGITTLWKTEIIIGGMGFKPGDSVYLNLVGVEDKSEIKAPIDVAQADDEGNFTVILPKEVKTIGILKLQIDPQDNKPVLAGNPIPEGPYLIKAECVESGRKAECIIVAEAPSKLDVIKDKIAVLLKKIKKQ